MQFSLLVAIAVWVARFFKAAEHRFRYINGQKQETIEYSLWLPTGRKAPALCPPPQKTSHRLRDLPGSKPVLFVGHDVEVHESLPQYLAGIDIDCLDVLAVSPASILSASTDYLARDSMGNGQAAMGFDPMTHTEHRCLWFQKHRSLIAEFDHEVGCRPMQIGQSIESAFGVLEQRIGQTDDGVVLVQSLGHENHSLERVATRHRLKPLYALFCACEVVVVHIIPWLCLFAAADRDLAYLALTLALLTRLALALNGRIKLAAVITEFLLRPYQLLRMAMLMFKTPSDSQGTYQNTEEMSAIASGYFGCSLSLATENQSLEDFEWHVLKGQPLGHGGLATWVDQWILNRLGFRAYRWANIEIRRLLRTIRPSSSLVVGFSSLTAYPDELNRPWYTDVDPVSLEGHAGGLDCHELRITKLEAERNARFDCIIFHGNADGLSDSDLRHQFRQLGRCLKPGGHLLMTSSIQLGMPVELIRRLDWAPRLRSAGAVEEHLHACGFQLTDARTDPFGIRVVSMATKR